MSDTYIRSNSDYIINSNNLSSTGNVIAPYFVGDGSQLTGITTSGNAIAYGSSNVKIGVSGGNIQVNVGGVSNVAVYTTTGEQIKGTISTTGDITSGGYFIGDGSQLTNISASGAKISNGSSNVNVTTSGGNVNVAVGGSNVAIFASTGEYITGEVSATGNITGNYILGNGALLSGVVTTASKISNGTSNVDIAGSGGNVTIGVSGSSNVVVVSTGKLTLQGQITATGNITAGYFIGDGSQLTGISVSGAQISNGSTQVNIPTAGDNVVVTVGGLPTANLTSLGINVSGVVSATGTVTGSNVVANGGNLVAAQGYVQVGNGLISTSTYDGSFTDGIVVDYQEGNGRISIGGSDGLNIYNSGVGASQIVSIGTDGSISTNGNVVVGGQVSATGNVTGNYILGNGALLSGVVTSASKISNGTSNVDIAGSGGNITIGVNGSSNVAVFDAAGEHVTGIVSASGNITGGNLNTAGLISATGTVTGFGLYAPTGVVSAGGTVRGGNILTAGSMSAAGTITGANVYAGNILTTGSVSATGNVTSDNYILGNGYYLTGLGGVTYGDANVAAFLPGYTGNLAGGNANITTTLYTQNIASSSGSNSVVVQSNAFFNGNANVAGNVNVTSGSYVNGDIIGNTTGTHNGLVYSIDIRYMSWDFGSFSGTFTNPIQYLLNQAGNIDMGTIVSPSALSIDIGPILSTP